MATNTTAIEKLDQLVVFRLADEEFGAPIQQVREIVVVPDITRMPQTPNFIRGVINLRGQVIAVLDMIMRLGLPENPEKAPEHIVIVAAEDYTVGMIVDEVLEVLRITEENIEITPSLVETNIDDRYIEGIARVDERLIIVLNLFQVLKAEEAAQLERVAAEEEVEIREEETMAAEADKGEQGASEMQSEEEES